MTDSGKTANSIVRYLGKKIQIPNSGV